MTDAGRAAASAVPTLVPTLLVIILAAATGSSHVRVASPPFVQANDNRVAAGTVVRDTLDLRLVVAMAKWRPEADSGPVVTAAAISEEGKPPQIPAPLIRVREGMAIVASVHNALADSTIGVVGLGDHPTTARDTLFVRPGETKVARFAAGSPGTYLYRAIIGSHSPDDTLHEREQAAGAFVVDPRGGSPHDRIFVINIWGEQTGPKTYSNALALNGRSWPWTERIDAVVGDTVRWRVVNASNRVHPMHLHGAYFRIDGKGDAFEDTAYAPPARRLAVTEDLGPQTTMFMEWSPVRPGRWVFHCHIAFHVIPTDARVIPAEHGGHDEGSNNPLEHMAGLVLGIDAKPKPGATEAARNGPRRLDLYVDEGAKRGRSARAMGFVLQHGSTPPASDSVTIPGTTIVLTRDEPTDVLVHNRLEEPTSIHWHGLELESFSDGVAGWSGTAATPAQAIRAGATFLAHLSMPRAGTFIYHTHLRDLTQLASGLYGAIVVLEPGAKFDPRFDHVYTVGWDGEGPNVHLLVDGDSVSSPPLEMRVGETHRLRFINIGAAGPGMFSLRSDSTLATWRALAKDGADLPRSQATPRPARLIIDVGETYDFEFTPTHAGNYTLSTPVTPAGPKGPSWTQRVVVR